MYLLKHSRPELSNPIRELSRCVAGPSGDNLNEMYRVIKWVLDNPDAGLRIDPEVESNEKGEIIWRLVGVCDLTWGSNKEDGKSAMGHILCFMGRGNQKHKTLFRSVQVSQNMC